MRLLKSLTRISSYVGKELLETIRRPGAFVSLVLGPFLIMALFGVGYSGSRRPMEALLVLPAGTNLPRDAAYYQRFGQPGLNVREVTEDGQAARERLRRQEVDLVVVAPPDMEERFRKGEQAVIRVEYNLVDPILSGYAGFLSYQLTKEVNREIVTRAVGEGQQYALRQANDPSLRPIPPDVVASPTRVDAVNVAQTPPGVISFFGPAVLALILQHMAVTLSALSLVRERLSGAMELFRVAPVTTMEIVIGKYLGFGILTGAVAAVTTALLVTVLGVPLLGSVGFFATVVGLVIFASLGVGLIISVVADSERQAVQLSLLVLLASVFFSGFVLPIEEFQPAVRTAAYALPVTNGIRLIQDVMLRGGTNAVWQLGILLGTGLAYFWLTVVLLRRAMGKI